MEQNNFENQAKEKLNSREIKPSEMAWDRLDAMLSVAEEKKTKRSFGWLSIAASILVLLTVGLYFINQKNTVINPNQTVVDHEIVNDSADKPKEIVEPISTNKNIQPIVQLEENATTNNKPSTINQQPTTNNRVSIINQKQSNQSTKINNQGQNNEVIAQTNGQSEIKNQSPIIEKSTPIENKEVIAQTESKTATSSKVTVNANSLLSQVDGELTLTFREKVFKKVAKNYKEVKVALSNRNNLE